MDPNAPADWSGVKSSINNLLWSHLPGKTTIEEADTIAHHILALVQKEHERQAVKEAANG